MSIQVGDYVEFRRGQKQILAGKVVLEVPKGIAGSALVHKIPNYQFCNFVDNTRRLGPNKVESFLVAVPPKSGRVKIYWQKADELKHATSVP